MRKRKNQRPIKPATKSNHTVLLCILLTLATVGVYIQTLGFDFVSLDDIGYVKDNPYVLDGFSSESIKWAFTTNHTANWHPVTWLSLMADAQFFGTSPGVFHATNTILHIANTLLLFLLLARITSMPLKSAFVAALFALHPMHVESAAWISERKDVLSTFFGLLAIMAYCRYAQKPNIKRYLLIAGAFALSLMAKPMLVTLPFVLILLDYWPLQRVKTDDTTQINLKYHAATALGLIAEKLPLLAMSIASSIVTYIFQHSVAVVKSLDALSFYSRIANASTAYILYIYKMFWPSKMTMLYPLPEGFAVWQTIAAIAILIAITVAVLYSRKDYLVVGWLWFVGTMVPVIGLVHVGMQQIADRYTYVPYIGLFVAVIWLVCDVAGKLPWRRNLLIVLSIITLGPVSWLAFKQVSYWKNSLTLYGHAVEVSDKNFLAHNNLGIELNNNGQIAEAIEHFKAALRIKPIYHDAITNLGPALISQGKIDEAISNYREYLKVNPNAYEIHTRLARTLSKKGDHKEALEHCEKALAISPQYEHALYQQATIQIKAGQLTAAEKSFKKMLRIYPENYRAWHNLGTACFMQKKFDLAEKYYKKSLSVKHDYVDAHCNLAAVYINQKKIDMAISQYKIALAIDPQNARATQGLKTLEKQRRK